MDRNGGGSGLSKVTVNKERCKACQCCIKQCPKGAIGISSKLNSKGYQYVEIDDEKCIQCGVCYYVCPDWVFESEG